MENSLTRYSMNAQRLTNKEKKGGRTSHNVQASLMQVPKCSFPRTGHKGVRNSKRFLEPYSAPSEDYDYDNHLMRHRSSAAVKRHDFYLFPNGDSSYSYLQTSSQLVLFPDSDYVQGPQWVPPTWDQLALVHVQDSEGLLCPICLCPPIAPRIERCGHVYCWPCAIQYIKYDNHSNSKKCAVCSRILMLDDMKRASVTTVSPVKVGDQIKLSLMIRSKCGLQIYLASDESKEKLHRSNFNYCYVTNYELLKNSHQMELNDLLAYKSVCQLEGDNMEILPFIDRAIDHLVVESEIGGFPNKASNSVNKMDTNNSQGSKRKSFSSVDSVYFYQASDGQFIYLDGLMWQCLIKEYTDVFHLPHEIEVKVISLKSCQMSEHLRKRLHYLSHLPLGHAFSLIEVDLSPPLVSESTLSSFASSLDARAVERDRHRLEDLKLTEMKKAAEDRLFPSSHGFASNYRSELPPQRIPSSPSDFTPLQSSIPTETHQSQFTTTFAEIARSGAMDIVGPNRVANFTRNPQSQTSKSFNIANEVWPSLSLATSDTGNARCIPSGSWRHSTSSTSSSTSDANNPF